MKIIGIFKAWPDTSRENLPCLKYRKFGQRSFIKRCKTFKEWEAFVRDLTKKGYATI